VDNQPTVLTQVFEGECLAQKKCIEALNSLSSFIYGLKGQLGDQEDLGREIEAERQIELTRMDRLPALEKLSGKFNLILNYFITHLE
jgi:hypothetical protein